MFSMKKLLIFACMTLAAFTAQSQEYDITKFGVGSDSTKLSTRAIQAVIDKAHASGGGTMLFPKEFILVGLCFLSLKRR